MMLNKTKQIQKEYEQGLRRIGKLIQQRNKIKFGK